MAAGSKMFTVMNAARYKTAHDKRDVIYFRKVQHLHFRAPLTTVVAAAFHGCCKVKRTAERGNKQRDKHRNQRLDALHQTAAFHICTAGLLRRHDLLGLFEERRHKAQRDRHHHCEFMHRDMQRASGFNRRSMASVNCVGDVVNVRIELMRMSTTMRTAIMMLFTMPFRVM